MLKFRVIARLDIKPPRLIKTVRLDGVRPVGDPAEFAFQYDSQGIDELIYLDVVASLYGRNSLAPVLEQTTDNVFTPVTVGGGVRTIPHARALLNAGADKIAVNTAILARPAFLRELTLKYGSSTITVQIDAKRNQDSWECLVEGGRTPTGVDAVDWAAACAEKGCGEILVTSVDREGTGQGPDTDLIRALADLPVPVIYSGGIGSPAEVVGVYENGAAGVVCAGGFHFDRFTVSDVKSALAHHGVPVKQGP